MNKIIININNSNVIIMYFNNEIVVLFVLFVLFVLIYKNNWLPEYETKNRQSWKRYPLENRISSDLLCALLHPSHSPPISYLIVCEW